MRIKKQVLPEETIKAVEAVEAEVVKKEVSVPPVLETAQNSFIQDSGEDYDSMLTSIENLDSEIGKIKVGTDGWANRLFKLVTKIYLEVKVLKANKA